MDDRRMPSRAQLAPPRFERICCYNLVMSEKITKSENEWRKELTPEQYRITRLSETEKPFAGEYWDNHEKGIYRCTCCGNELFGSETKYDSGSGWPSFYAPLSKDNISRHEDRSHSMNRVEIRCDRCNAHLGHVFEDGPDPTGLRYCVNSAALKFEGSE
jgi:peptide-methionine (R)-S-oxide reductase